MSRESAWIETTLGEVANWGSGGTPSRRNPEFFKGAIPWIKTGELGDKYIQRCEEHISEDAIKRSSAKIFKKGSVGIAMYGATIGKLSIFGIDASTNQACAVAEPKEILDKEFLYYFLLSERRSLIKAGKGGAQPNISQGVLKGWPISLPSINEQKDIVAKIETLFSELDKGIESLKTARQQLKAYRQAVLKHAFEGKLTEQWRQQNPDKLKSSMPEVRERQGMATPESWTVCCVQDVLVLGPSNGRSVKDRDGGFPVLRLTALKNGKIDVSEYKNGNWCREQAEPYIVKKGDFLLSRGNGSKHLVGRGGLVPEHTFEVAFPDTMVRLRVDQNLGYPDYFSLVWQSRVIRQQIEDSVRTTAGIYKINQEHIKGFSIPLPGIAEQKEIVNRLQKILSIVDKQESELIDALASSESLRQSILRKAFSGQLSIKIGSVK